VQAEAEGHGLARLCRTKDDGVLGKQKLTLTIASSYTSIEIGLSLVQREHDTLMTDSVKTLSLSAFKLQQR
jgi:hypothetical protein